MSVDDKFYLVCPTTLFHASAAALVHAVEVLCVMRLLASWSLCSNCAQTEQSTSCISCIFVSSFSTASFMSSTACTVQLHSYRTGRLSKLPSAVLWKPVGSWQRPPDANPLRQQGAQLPNHILPTGYTVTPCCWGSLCTQGQQAHTPCLFNLLPLSQHEEVYVVAVAAMWNGKCLASFEAAVQCTA